MAERRMFALKIIDSDAFLDMPDSTQNLYFHLSMRADDDGFISNPKKIMRMIGASDDDMKILLSKRFLLAFDTGIVVIKHWRLHNYIAKDRYHETIYKEEKEKLFVKANGAYTDHPDGVDETYTPCIQNDDPGKVRLGKVREGKESIGKANEGDEENSYFPKNELPLNTKSKTQPKQKKKPLSEREPENDIERVEKIYTQNVLTLYQQGKLRTDKIDPAIWSRSRKRMNELFITYSVDEIIKAVNNAVKSDFQIRSGYVLPTILSSGCFSGLLSFQPEKQNNLKVFERTAMIDIPEV
jgi:hypothetical protein